MPSSRLAHPEPEVLERLSIGVWRGYVSACFYARTLGTNDVIRVSPTFRTGWLPWRPRLPLPQTPQAFEALRALEASLLAEGWERCAHEPDAKWHECEFRRFVRPAP
jgi:hypothetical protein